MNNPFPWTVHAQNFASVVYPIGVLFYHNLHDFFAYRRYFVNPSPIKASENEDFARLLEEELVGISERRQRPLKNVKMSTVAVDAIESKTIGSFTFTYGALLKLSSRLLINDVNQFRKTLKNLNAFIGYYKPFVDVDEVTDAELEKVLLSECAVRFVVARQLENADYSSHILTPAAAGFLIFNASIVLLKPLARLIGAPFALVTTMALSALFTYYVVLVTDAWRELNLDRDIYSCDNPKYSKGCEEYLTKSMELGKLLREKNGADSYIGKKFAENGDYLKHIVPYSQRLNALRDYLKKQEQIRKSMARKVASGKIKIQKASNS